MVNGSKKSRTIRGKSGEDASLWSGADSYVSMNNYRSDASDKSSSNVESVNGFFVDIDICHGDGQFDVVKADFIRERCMTAIKETLGERYACYCCSGRGIALYYLYDEPLCVEDVRAMEEHRKAYKSVINAFRSILKVYIGTGDVEVDGTVMDLARVVRIPETRNNGAGRDAFVVEEDFSRTYPPEMLWEMFAAYREAETEEHKKAKAKRSVGSAFSSRREKLKKCSVVNIAGGNDGVIPAVYRNNSLGICKAIEQIVAKRRMGEGSLRNNILFIYYNNAKVYHSKEPWIAVKETLELNSAFDTPLSEEEVSGIMSGVDNHVEMSGAHGDGFYLFSREKVAEMIGMTDDEALEVGFFRSKEKRKQTRKNKEKTKKDEEAVLSLWKGGATWRQIAEETGRSNAFIGRVLASTENKEVEKDSKQETSVRICFDLENKQGERETPSIGATCDSFTKVEGMVEGAYPYSESDVESDEELMGVVELLLSGKNAYVSGKGGTGKSLVSKTFVKKALESGRKVLVVAPSGLAAFNVGGSTVHSAISMEASRVLERGDNPVFRGVESLKSVDTVLVDECGMLRIDHFAYLVKTMKQAERKFGKVIQLVMVGDFLQIRPVVTSEEKGKLLEVYGEKYTYQAYEDEDLWRSCLFHYARLEKNRRQVDQTFAEFMDKAREGDVSCLDYFGQFEKRGFYSKEGYVHLCAYRSEARRINAAIIARHAEDESFKTFEGELVAGRFGENTFSYRKQSFFVGMPVIATSNHKRGLFHNGQMGTVVGVKNGWIEVKFQGKEKATRVKKALIGGETSTVSAFPLLPAYAITIHKCQSQTFEKVVVHTSWGPEKGMFEEGQMYVALSRVKSPEGLVICGHITKGDIERPSLEAQRNGETHLRDYEREAILF